MTEPTPASDAGFIEIVRDDTVWRFEREFLESNWTCLFGRGCKGILDRPAEELNQGCCSLGAHFGDGPAGEAEAVHRGGGRYVSIIGGNALFHHVDDVGAAATDPATIARFAAALGALARSLAN